MGSVSQKMDALDTVRQGDLLTTTEAVVQFVGYRDRIDRGEQMVVSTGVDPLDQLLGGGFLNSGLYILAARPAVGKTALALFIAENVAKAGGVLFVSLEMNAEQLTARRLARLTKLSSNDILTNKLSDAENVELANAYRILSKSALSICQKPRCTVSDIRPLARKIKNLRLVVIDYLGLLTPEMRQNKSKYEQVTQISNDLKALARSLNVPVLALAQLNRGNELRTDKRPCLADLRDSGAIEQDADGVLLLHRDDYYMDSSVEIAPAEVHLAKNRHGRTGKIELTFDKIHNRFLVIKYDK